MKISRARVEFLKQAQDPQGVYAVEFYAPAKWALAQGYVILKESSNRRHFITPEGREALKKAGIT